MTFKITFSDDTTRTFEASVTFEIDDGGVLALTKGSDFLLYSPHAWKSIGSPNEPGEINKGDTQAG